MALGTPTLTRGRLVEMLLAMEGATDDTPVIGYSAALGDYTNIEDVTFDQFNGDFAITIEIKHNYDERQW